MTTIADLLLRHAAAMPDRIAYRYLAAGDDETASLTFAELAGRAQALAAELARRHAPGTRIVLLLESGLAFIEALFAAMLAALVPVAVDLPRPNRPAERLHGILRHCGARAFVTSGAERARIEALAAAIPALGALDRHLIAPGAAEAAPSAPRRPLAPEMIAFIQYTSGSTSEPKGVAVSHGNLMANQHQIRAAFAHDETTRFVGWLPMFHDMGLVGNVMQPLFLGIECTLMPPAAFVQRPLRWLRAISKYRATTSGGPNFAYDHCVERIAESDIDGLDLSSWRVAFNGAEPVRAATLAAFARKFARAGFDPTAFLPCFGLAEATLFVSGRSRYGKAAPTTLRVLRAALEDGKLVPTDLADPARAVELVSSGPPAPGDSIVIVDGATGKPCAPGDIGEIWVAGPSVAGQYFNDPAATATLLQARLGEAGEFLRTGDLGALWQGELYVAGRIKNVIIRRGRKIHAEDVEQLVSRSHPLFRQNRCAAFSVAMAGALGGDDEALVLVQEAARRPRSAEEVADALDGARRIVAHHSDIVPQEIILARPGAIPLTSSGKIRHAAVRAAYLSGEIKPFAPLG